MAINFPTSFSAFPFNFFYGTAGVDDFVGDSRKDSFQLTVNMNVMDTVDGSTGTDTLSYQYADRGVRVTMGEPGETGYTEAEFRTFRFYNPLTHQLYEQFETQTVTEFTGIENVTGSGFDDTITANSAANRLEGLGGHDVIRGGGGDDVITGGRGGDELYGDDAAGARGADTFVFTSFLDSTLGPVLSSQITGPVSEPSLGYDTIMDFEVGVDTIDLSAIDADSRRSGNQAFHVVDALSGAGGELVLTEYDSANLYGSFFITMVGGDIDGDGEYDFRFGVSTPFALDPLSASDFLL